MEHLGGKKTCKYYKACGNVENCSRCKENSKAKKSFETMLAAEMAKLKAKEN